MVKDCIALAKTETDALGFIPEPRYYEAQAKGTLFHQVENGVWVGFLLVGGFQAGGKTHIWQECIDKSARGYGSGTRLVNTLIDVCRKRFVYEIVLRCADNLESNAFWCNCGFSLISTLEPGNRRRRKVNVYRMQLYPDLFSYCQ